MLEPAVVRAVERALGADVSAVEPVAGGCVSAAARVRLMNGVVRFVKAAPPGAGASVLLEEARSLRRLRESGALRVPDVVAVDRAWLVLEWLEPGPADWPRLGHGLATLHGVRQAAWGWDSDNWIGPLPQANQAAPDWAAFWRERRLLPQLERATTLLDAGTRRQFDTLLDRLDELLGPADEEGASLLHGDLWHGNVHMSDDGPALVDPASYHGHREVDLAMAALFGGLPAEFERAYTNAWPLLPGAALRRPVYQLYYLLVHVNLFGGSYIAGTRRALREVLV